jgi:hypothetical protein
LLGVLLVMSRWQWSVDFWVERKLHKSA